MNGKVKVTNFIGWVKSKVYGEDFNVLNDDQNLSKTKYQIAFANGSTIASVKAIIKDTFEINIKTVMAIMKCPMV